MMIIADEAMLSPSKVIGFPLSHKMNHSMKTNDTSNGSVYEAENVSGKSIKNQIR